MPVAGRFTGVDLSDTRAFAPAGAKARSAFPPFSRDAARFALELAATAYDFELDQWIEAGFGDISIQVDDKLLADGRGRALPSAQALRQSESDTLAEKARMDKLEERARKRAQPGGTARQLLGILGKSDVKKDSGKAIAMLKRASGGRYVLLLGFAGTGKRLRDWLPNLDFMPEDGMHSGFLRLARQLLRCKDDMRFPMAARELGLASLSLSDILEETQREDSRFFVFMAGHSQGAAVVQTFTRLMLLRGARMEHYLGYGFASPMVASDFTLCSDKYPLYHIVNSDDIVPRVGARAHLGTCMVLSADDALRDACYQKSWRSAEYRRMMAYTMDIQNTLDVLYAVLALVQRASNLPDGKIGETLARLAGYSLPSKMLALANTPLHSGLDRLREYLRQSISRWEMGDVSEERLREVMARQSFLTAEDVHEQIGSLFMVMAGPHSLVSKRAGAIAPYTYIVNNAFRMLAQGGAVLRAPRAQASARRAAPNRFAGYSGARASRKKG